MRTALLIIAIAVAIGSIVKRVFDEATKYERKGIHENNRRV